MKVQNSTYTHSLSGSNNKLGFNGFFNTTTNKATKESTRLLGNEIGNTLREQSNTIISMLQDAPQERISFMDSLASAYRADNFWLSLSKKEDTRPLINIYNMVTKPQTEHFNIVSKSYMPFKTLETVFTNANDLKSLRFVQIVQHDILDGSQESANHIVEMLKSPHREAYLKNPLEYKSYLILHSDKKNTVKDLDKLIDEGNYDRKIYDIKLEVSNLMKNKKIKPLLEGNTDFVEKRYTPEGMKFLNKIGNEYLSPRKNISMEECSDILLMYASTSPKNINIRMEILDKFKNSAAKYNSQKDETRQMWNLFNRIDSDEHIANFVDKALGDNIKVDSIKELNDIIDIVPPKKAEIFHKNIARIVENTNIKEREHALLTEIENPLFKNPRMETEKQNSIRLPQNDNIFTKFVTRLQNKINLKRYEQIKSKSEVPVKAKQVVITPAIPQLRIVASVDIPKLNEVISTSPANINKSEINLVSTLKQSPQAKKLKVKSDVNNIIKSKLGKKTFEKQQNAYEQKATIIKLKLLPEIFDSISETRKAEHLAGNAPTVKNADAFKLYEKIQGKNKKLVRYMLKNIAKLIDRSEAEIAQNKKTNPDFRAKDAKAYYDSIYDSMVEKYGKLK